MIVTFYDHFIKQTLLLLSAVKILFFVSQRQEIKVQINMTTVLYARRVAMESNTTGTTRYKNKNEIDEVSQYLELILSLFIFNMCVYKSRKLLQMQTPCAFC